MSKKTKTFNELKLLNSKFYTKNFVRENKLNNKKSLTLDNNSFIQKASSLKSKFIGSSINNQEKIILNKYNHNFKLKTIVNFKNLQTNTLNDYKINVKNITTNNTDNNLVSVTKNIKGGILANILGIQGFIPKSQYFKIAKILLLNNSKDQFFKINFLKKVRRFLPIRVPLKPTKFAVYPNIEPNKFSNNKNFKKYYHYTNLIFINDENKKKIRKH